PLGDSAFTLISPLAGLGAVGDRAFGLDLKGGVILSLHLKVIQEMPLFLRDRQRSEFSFYQTSTASIKSVKIFKIDFYESIDFRFPSIFYEINSIRLYIVCFVCGRIVYV